MAGGIKRTDEEARQLIERMVVSATPSDLHFMCKPRIGWIPRSRAKSSVEIDALLVERPTPPAEIVTQPHIERHCNTCDKPLAQRDGERHDRFMQRTTCGLSCGRIYGGRKGSRGPRELAEVAIAFVMTVTQRAWEASTFIAPPARAKLMAGR